MKCEVLASIVFSATLILNGVSAIKAQTVDSATVVPGAYTQGIVKTGLTAAGYTNTNINLSTWNLTAGGANYDINYENPQYQANTLLAFGDGGSVELQLTTPIAPMAGQKNLGIFTAQAVTGGLGSLFNGNMEAAILVSSDGVNWYNLQGTQITSPTTYVGLTYSLNAPTMAYNYGTGATAWSAGTQGKSYTLPIADYLTPMPDDTLFNNPNSTNAQRLALTTDTSALDYAEAFGNSGGGNWFDISGSGLSSVAYLMLNGDANDPSTGGVRLENVFATPEPASTAVLSIASLILFKRKRNRM